MVEQINQWEIRNVYLPDNLDRRRVIGIAYHTVQEVYDEPKFAEYIDANGEIACPGFVDIHVHLREPGLPGEELAETYATGERAALAGGITLVGTMPNPKALPLISPENADKTFRLAGRRFVHMLFWYGATKDNINTFGEVRGFNQILGVKLVMCDTTGMPGITNFETQRRICQKAADLNWPVAVHCEDQEIMLHHLNDLRAQRQPLVSD